MTRAGQGSSVWRELCEDGDRAGRPRGRRRRCSSVKKALLVADAGWRLACLLETVAGAPRLACPAAEVWPGHRVAEEERVSWEHFDRLRASEAASSRSAELVDARGDSGAWHMLRHIPALVSLTPNGVIDEELFACAAAILLALFHFNNAIATVTPEVARVVGKHSDGCAIRFTTTLFDTEYSPIRATAQLLGSVIARKHQPPAEWRPDEPYATAIIGAVRSEDSSPMAIVGGVNQLVQVSAFSTSAELDDKDQYPYFARVVPSSDGDANAAVDYLANVLGVTHLGIFYVRDVYGTSYAESVANAAARTTPPIQVITSSVPFKQRYTTKQIDDALRPLAESGFRYFFNILFDTQYKIIMPRAVQIGIAGPGYFWIGGDSLSNLVNLKTEPGSELQTAVTGTALILIALPDTLAGQPNYDGFADEWKKRLVDSPEGLDYFLSKLPRSVTDVATELNLTGYRFSTQPSAFVLLHYDAAMALALAACTAQKLHGDLFSPHDYYSTLVHMQYRGAFGIENFDPTTGTRSFRTMVYSMYNVIPKESHRVQNGYAVFETQTTHVYANGVWSDYGKPFIYSDGTHKPPPVLPPLDRQEIVIARWAQAYGFLLGSLSVAISIGYSLWTCRHRETRVIKASQPFFLWMLCAGTLSMGVSIYALGLQDPTSQKILDCACMSFPWLFSLGYCIAFSALFSKTRRINRIFHSRSHNRVRVMPKDVLGPFIFLFLANLAILLAWTLLSPLTFERRYEEGSMDRYGRSTVSYGNCWPAEPSRADRTFLVLLVLLDFGILLYSDWEAYRARTITTEYSESRYIAMTMVNIVQAALLGVPIVILVKGTPTGRYFMTASFIFVLCMAVLLPMFLPKMYHLKVHFAKVAEKAEKKRVRQKRREQMDAASRSGCSMDSIAVDGNSSSCISSPSLSSHVGLRYASNDLDEDWQSTRDRYQLAILQRENLLLKQQQRRLNRDMRVLRKQHSVSRLANSSMFEEFPNGITSFVARRLSFNNNNNNEQNEDVPIVDKKNESDTCHPATSTDGEPEWMIQSKTKTRRSSLSRRLSYNNNNNNNEPKEDVLIVDGKPKSDTCYPSTATTDGEPEWMVQSKTKTRRSSLSSVSSGMTEQ